MSPALGGPPRVCVNKLDAVDAGCRKGEQLVQIDLTGVGALVGQFDPSQVLALLVLLLRALVLDCALLHRRSNGDAPADGVDQPKAPEVSAAVDIIGDRRMVRWPEPDRGTDRLGAVQVEGVFRFFRAQLEGVDAGQAAEGLGEVVAEGGGEQVVGDGIDTGEFILGVEELLVGLVVAFPLGCDPKMG
jgi:hypothetical protein